MLRVLLAVGALLCAVLLFRGLRGPAADEPERDVTVERSSEPATAVEVENPAPVASPAARAAVTIEAAGSLPVLESGDGVDAVPRSAVQGRVVDPDGRPVANLRVTISSNGPWREDVEVPVLTRGRYSMPGYETSTGEDGQFAFDVPLPTSTWITLNVVGDPYHSLVDRNFGYAGGRKETPLIEGTNDLGDLLVLDAGALRGKVLDESGAPVVGALVRGRATSFGLRSPTAYSEEDGRYTLGHLGPGEVTVEAQIDGFVAQEGVQANVIVGETLEGPTFTLARARTLSGVLVDLEGQPVANAIIEGWPLASGRGSITRSGADGAFTMNLPQSGHYRIEVDRDDRYLPWGGHGASDANFEPGTSDIRIVLEPSTPLEVRVVDGASGEPLDAFVLQVTGPWTGSTSMPRECEGGTVMVQVQSGETGLRVEAEGYSTVAVEVDIDPSLVAEGATAVQTIKMQRGLSIIGRVTAAGSPATGARAILCAQPLPKEPGGTIDPDDWFGNTWTIDVEGPSARQQEQAADADGRFRFAGLSPGTYRLIVKGEGGSPHTLDNLSIGDDTLLDLGDVALHPEARVEGRVLLAGAASAAGLRVRVDFGSMFDAPEVASDGAFAFGGLAAGDHTLTLQADGTRVVEDRIVKFAVLVGETARVDIDLTDALPVTVTVRVHDGALPLEGLTVTFEVEGVQIRRAGLRGGSAQTDETGALQALLVAGRTYVATLRDGHVDLGRSAEFVPRDGDANEVDVDLALGAVTLRLPADFDPPTDARLAVSLNGLAADGIRAPDGPSCHLIFGRPESFGSALGTPWEDSTPTIPRVVVGRYQASVSVTAIRDNAHVTLLPQLTTEVVVTRGGTSEIVVPR